MQASPEKISISKALLSETQPICGSINLHPARSAPRWDMHYGLEFGIIYSGEERRFFRDKSKRTVAAGNIWFCGMWEPHGMEVVIAPCETIVLQIWPPLLAQMSFPEVPDFCALAPFNAPPKQRPQTHLKTKETMINFGRQLKDILSSDVPHQKVRLRFALQEILLSIFESWPESGLWGRRAPDAEFSQINKALQMVFESHSFVSTDAAARACGMNRHKFSALFRSWMNIHFADFSLRHRLQQAAAQLRDDPSEPIKATAWQWGFANESHFCRLFLKHFGVSPGEYRRRMFSRK